MKKKNKCEFCEGNLIETNGEYVCTTCGVVNRQIFISDDALSQLSWNQEIAPGKRVHIVDGLGSYIGYHNGKYFQDGKGSNLTSKKQYKFRKLKRRYNLRIKINNKETDYRSLMSLNRVSSYLKISNVIKKRAAYLYKIVTAAERAEQIEKISNHIVLVALCLLVAIRESASNAPIRLKEVISTFKEMGHRVSGKAIIKLAQILPTELGVSLRIRKSEDYIQRIVSSVIENKEIKMRLEKANYPINKYDRDLIHLTNELLNEINRRMRGGRNPYIFAVSVVYCADRILGKTRNHRQILTQKKLADICDVAEYSIRDHHRTVLKQKFNEKVKEKTHHKEQLFDEQNHRYPMFF